MSSVRANDFLWAMVLFYLHTALVERAGQEQRTNEGGAIWAGAWAVFTGILIWIYIKEIRSLKERRENYCTYGREHQTHKGRGQVSGLSHGDPLHG
jgi:hypothetical protein